MRTLVEIDTDIVSVEQKKIRPMTEFTLDPTNDKGFGLAALNRIRSLESQLVDLRAERKEVVDATNSV